MDEHPPEYIYINNTNEDYDMLNKLLAKQLDLTRYAPHMDVTFGTKDVDVRIRKRSGTSWWKKVLKKLNFL